MENEGFHNKVSAVKCCDILSLYVYVCVLCAGRVRICLHSVSVTAEFAVLDCANTLPDPTIFCDASQRRAMRLHINDGSSVKKQHRKFPVSCGRRNDDDKRQLWHRRDRPVCRWSAKLIDDTFRGVSANRFRYAKCISNVALRCENETNGRVESCVTTRVANWVRLCVFDYYCISFDINEASLGLLIVFVDCQVHNCLKVQI